MSQLMFSPEGQRVNCDAVGRKIIVLPEYGNDLLSVKRNFLSPLSLALRRKYGFIITCQVELSPPPKRTRHEVRYIPFLWHKVIYNVNIH